MDTSIFRSASLAWCCLCFSPRRARSSFISLTSSVTGSDDIDHSEYAWMWEISPWTDTQIRLFSNLPLEIVRLVFEIAIYDKPRPLHLLLVCQQTRQWLEPLVYLQVNLESEDRTRMFHRTISERRTLPIKYLTLFWPPPPLWTTPRYFISTEDITTIVRGLPGLHCLACWESVSRGRMTNVVLDSAITSDGEDLFPYKHLRRVTVSTASLAARGIGFGHRAFRDITHLDIDFEPTVDWESLQSMQNLTHLSVNLVRGMIWTTEQLYWFQRILDACPPSVNIVIFGIVNDFNADFDLIDSEGDYLPPGWPPYDPSLGVEGWTEWLVSGTRCYNDVDFGILHPIAQLASGRVDPRAVAAAVTSKIPQNQLFRDLLVSFVSPERWLYCDWTVPNHRDCWTVAGDIIEKRKGLTYAKLVGQML